jgi:hypothetical protein
MSASVTGGCVRKALLWPLDRTPLRQGSGCHCGAARLLNVVSSKRGVDGCVWCGGWFVDLCSVCWCAHLTCCLLATLSCSCRPCTCQRGRQVRVGCAWVCTCVPLRPSRLLSEVGRLMLIFAFELSSAHTVPPHLALSPPPLLARAATAPRSLNHSEAKANLELCNALSDEACSGGMTSPARPHAHTHRVHRNHTQHGEGRATCCPLTIILCLSAHLPSSPLLPSPLLSPSVQFHCSTRRQHPSLVAVVVARRWAQTGTRPHDGESCSRRRIRHSLRQLVDRRGTK